MKGIIVEREAEDQMKKIGFAMALIPSSEALKRRHASAPGTDLPLGSGEAIL